jgi:hypothetical protein
MSADNGVYILKTKGSDGYEYRVSYAMAIENIEYEPDYGRFNKEMLIMIFGKSPVFYDETKSLKEACRIKDSVINNDFWLEYGICEIDASDIKFPE